MALVNVHNPQPLSCPYLYEGIYTAAASQASCAPSFFVTLNNRDQLFPFVGPDMPSTRPLLTSDNLVLRNNLRQPSFPTT